MVSEKSARKIGLIGSISVLVGAVIGIGIFFKNNGVFHNNNIDASHSPNGWGVLVSWILAAIIAFTTALSFAEIGFGKRQGAGIAGSAEAMYGKKFGRFINFNFNFFYVGLLNVAIAIFSAEAILNIFSSKTANLHLGFIILIGIGLVTIFLLFNYLSSKWATRYSIGSTFIKFIPLIMVGLAGMIYGGLNPSLSLFETKPKSSSFRIEGILSSLPAILFAFDSFLCVGSIKHEMKDQRKQVPLTIVLGMIICIVFYLFITIGQILVGAGTANGVFDKIFHNNASAKSAFNILINVFILISILGVLNSLVMTGLRSYEQAINSRVFLGHWLFSKLNNKKDNTKGLYLSMVIYSFWMIVLAIPSIIINTDAYIDGMSNFPTLFMFAIYGTIVLKGIINRIQKKEPENKIKVFWFVAPISVIGCYLAFGYQFFYQYSIFAFINPNEKIGWGLFYTYVSASAWKTSVVFMVCLIIFLIGPFINDWVLKYFYENKQKNIIKYMSNVNQEESNYIESINDWKKELIVIRG